MTMNGQKMNNYSLMRVSTVVVLAIALIISTFTLPLGVRTSADPLNNPPNMPSNPGPANNSLNVSVYLFLNWTGGDPDGNPVTYDVYLGTTTPPPLKSINQSSTFYNPSPLNYSATYFWRIIAWDNQSASTTGPLWKFSTKENSPPIIPNKPFPANDSTNVVIPTILNWTSGDPDGDPVTYDIYFSTTTPPIKVASNQSGTAFNPGTLNYTTLYYWMIVAWDNQNTSAKGPEWHFTTEVKPNSPPHIPNTPNPLNGATNVALNAVLSWAGGDPDGDPVTYDVYFGTSSSPPKLVHNQSELTYTPSDMDYNTVYYWKIVAWDNRSASTAGPVWHFTTIQGTSISVVITKPLEGMFYFQDQERFSLLNNTVVYGPITITANASASSGISKVEFYIDGKLKSTDTSGPYEFPWRPLIQFNGLSLKHTIEVIAYDNSGHNASAELNVTKWRFHPLPFVIAGLAIASRLMLHTTITGLVFNLQQSKIGTSFFAIRIHYKTVGPFRSAKGIINFKHCTGGVLIGPISMLQLGPFHKLMYISCTFLGNIRQDTGFGGGGARLPLKLLNFFLGQ